MRLLLGLKILLTRRSLLTYEVGRGSVKVHIFEQIFVVTRDTAMTCVKKKSASFF
jgi:hypothetical protein